MNLKKSKVKIIVFVVIFIIIALSALFVVCFYISPNIKWNKGYDKPNNLNEVQTIEYYFESINSRNPAKANTVSTVKLDKYSCRKILNANIVSIEPVQNPDIDLSSFYDFKEYYVLFNVSYFLGDSKGQAFEGVESCTNFYLVKDNEKSNWKIYQTGLG